VVLSNKRQSGILTEENTSKFLNEEEESDVISEESDDFSFYKGVEVATCVEVVTRVQVLSQRCEFNELKNHNS
jgi:hypothetical protein